MKKPQTNWVDVYADLTAKSSDIFQIWLAKQVGQNPIETPLDPFNLSEAWRNYLGHLAENPGKLADAQAKFWTDWLDLYQNVQTRLQGNQNTPDCVVPDRNDRRFRSDDWQNEPLFNSLKQTYLLAARWLLDTYDSTALGLDDKTRAKLRFFIRQYIDALSPSNFPTTNPDVWRETLASGGQNLLRGLENLRQDLESGHNLVNIRMTDPNAFKLGKDLATTKGQVIWRNRMCELIHYAPTQTKNYAEPLLIIPPWINKYYILDLRPENSLVRWALDQGHPVFMISWVNPKGNEGEITFVDYALEGAIPALEQALAATGTKQANVIGYCIGGTLLSMILAMWAKQGKTAPVKSATFLTTLLDFENAGELSLFIDAEQIRVIEQQMEKHGVLDGELLKTTFSMLRANDLIWSFVINNYLLGREPYPFDLLNWNSDSTNLPAAMHSYYLRNMYLQNNLIKPNGLALNDVQLDLSQINVPCYFLSTRDDHIAPWQNTYRGFCTVGAKNKKFVLAASGHIAGVVNPPKPVKYQYWSQTSATATTPDTFDKTAKITPGSWWPDWQKWVTGNKKPTAPAVKPKTIKGLPAAPGDYVRVKI